mmetsp:Transcript_38576/g.114575  ORF Transcript_38576/g.114575 Transcript_38576/m.114575 type:complete len:234 (-) Transcript_38576:595-1296(-)
MAHRQHVKPGSVCRAILCSPYMSTYRMMPASATAALPPSLLALPASTSVPLPPLASPLGAPLPMPLPAPLATPLLTPLPALPGAALGTLSLAHLTGRLVMQCVVSSVLWRTTVPGLCRLAPAQPPPALLLCLARFLSPSPPTSAGSAPTAPSPAVRCLAARCCSGTATGASGGRAPTSRRGLTSTATPACSSISPSPLAYDSGAGASCSVRTSPSTCGCACAACAGFAAASSA